MNTSKIFTYSMVAAIGWTTGKALTRFIARLIVNKCEADNSNIESDFAESAEHIMEVKNCE